MSGILLAHRHGGAKTGIVLPAIGASWLGGFYAGVIDTIKSPPIASDYYQTGSRFAVILADKTLETLSKTYGTNPGTVATTVWNGLAATAALNSSSFPAAQYCAGLTYPSDGESAWYLPALDELELVWRNLKPITNSNEVNSFDPGGFPAGAHPNGYNASSDPPGAAYSASVPAQTAVAAFKTGGAQAMSGNNYWTVTRASTGTAWNQYFGTTVPGRQGFSTFTTSNAVRPVRRAVLA